MLFLCFGLCLGFGVLCFFLCSNSCAFFVLWFVLGVWSFVLFLVLKQLCFFCVLVCAPLQLPHSTNLGDFRELCSGLCLEFGVLCFILVLKQLCFFCALVCAWGLEFCAISCAQTVVLFLCFGLCLEFGVLCFFLCSNSCAFFVLWFVLGVWSFVLFLVLEQLCFFCAPRSAVRKAAKQHN